ncbi:anti-sigma factor [Burkholderia sp. Ac-20353]|uniref:anti-sigma factor family protein n=1 Tax=Burkholderia sp. Ac-20353 TaxID=2703894 RepID=UPI00197B66CD|nr:anti-sigma factor [Burkholderia sp. Ac-20353]MBN3786871.1 anti-sigma factor [Burkholderia sp. Ac-20353]
MDHREAHDMLAGYLDNELSLSESLAFERHLAACDACRLMLQAQQRVSVLLKSSDLRFVAPDTLHARIRFGIGLRRTLLQRAAEWLTARKPRGASLWAPAGAVVVSTVALAWSGALYLSIPSTDVRLGTELVDSHVRSLQVNHLVDVVSTDRHTVKPWFDGKLDYAPPVLDLARVGYPLIGGRLDYLDGRAVAVMVYRYKLHPINLYVWPGADAGEAPRVYERLGYHLAHWSDGRMNYWAVTDAGAGALDGFVMNLRAGAGS